MRGLQLADGLLHRTSKLAGVAADRNRTRMSAEDYYLVAKVDSDTSVDPSGQVAESDEGNNVTLLAGTVFRSADPEIGNDTIDGGEGDDHLTGGDDDDEIFGGIDSFFFGNDDADVIDGGEGDDMLDGGNGKLDVGEIDKTYALGHDVIAQAATAAVAQFFMVDGHGSTRALLDAEAQVVRKNGTTDQIFAYDAYGNLLAGPGLATMADALTTLLYSGEQTDRATGLQYLRARVLRPSQRPVQSDRSVRRELPRSAVAS